MSHTASVNPMLHAVWSLNQLDQRLDFGQASVPERLQLAPRYQHHNDVMNYRMKNGDKGRVVLEHIALASYNVPDGWLNGGFNDIDIDLIQPAIRSLADQIQKSAKAIQFAKMPDVPSGYGAQAFHASHNNLAIRCTMQYNVERGGIETHLHVLFGLVN